MFFAILFFKSIFVILFYKKYIYMSSISKFRSSASTNRNQGGGNKLSGLPPSVGGNPFARNIWARKATVPFDKRNVVFCINQLGGIGRKSSMFLSTADGVRCVQPEDDTVTDNTGDDDTGDDDTGDNDTGDDDNSIMSHDSDDDTLDDTSDCENASTMLPSSISGDMISKDNFGRGVSITNTSKYNADTSYNIDASYVALVGAPHADSNGTFIESDKHAGFFFYKYTDASGWIQTQSTFDASGTTSGYSISKIADVSGVPVVLVSRTQDNIQTGLSCADWVSGAGQVVAYKYGSDGSFNNTDCSRIFASKMNSDCNPLFWDIYREAVTDNIGALFGYSVALASAEVNSYVVGYALVGEPKRRFTYDGVTWPEAGAAYMVKMKSCNAYEALVYTNDQNINQITESGCGKGSNIAYARFGFSVDMDTGDISGANAYGIIGAPGGVSGEDISGQAYIVKVNDLSWCLQDGLNQAMLDATYSTSGDGFGFDVAIRTIEDTQYAVVGAPYNSVQDSSGVAYVFMRSTGSVDSSWNILNPLTVNDLSGDSTLDGYRNYIQNYGSSVSISDKYIFVGNDVVPVVAVYDISGSSISYNKNIGYTERNHGGLQSTPNPISAEDDMAIVGYPQEYRANFDGPSDHYGRAETYLVSNCGTSCCCMSCFCQAGQYTNTDASYAICDDCPSGTYSEAGASECTDCPSGTYSEAGAYSCTVCAAGKYIDEGACIDCPARSFSAAGDANCISIFNTSDFGGTANCKLLIQAYDTNSGWIIDNSYMYVKPKKNPQPGFPTEGIIAWSSSKDELAGGWTYTGPKTPNIDPGRLKYNVGGKDWYLYIDPDSNEIKATHDQYDDDTDSFVLWRNDEMEDQPGFESTTDCAACDTDTQFVYFLQRTRDNATNLDKDMGGDGWITKNNKTSTTLLGSTTPGFSLEDLAADCSGVCVSDIASIQPFIITRWTT
jgi:hypothetical protein